MSTSIPFDEAGRIPMPGDNVAIATRRLEAGTRISLDPAMVAEDGGGEITLAHTVMEGHRFVHAPIAAEAPLLSWGLPFGHALRALEPGEYVCNEKILVSLKLRNIDFDLPPEPNFRDNLHVYELDSAGFRPGKQVELHAQPQSFQGFRRSGIRGVGTRNFILVLGTTSLGAGFARTLAARFAGRLGAYPNVDGVVAVTHTEGGGEALPNNLDFLLRTLSGFMVHPNAGAVLAVDPLPPSNAGASDDSPARVGNGMLRQFLTENGYPLQEVTHGFFDIQGDFEAELARAEEMINLWLPVVNGFERSEEPVSHLKLALQCGGSDAFSGISGNPLAGWVAKEVIRNGGAANLAETDELIGAEPYVLENVRDLETARSFLAKIEAFKERARWHGHSAEGNPSGGNQYRGLYNINLKSIGAARKKDPEVRLDHVIDYAVPMREPGYYFMDSPGNDLESIAGQVASGSNVILFVTGNGSITNFPFVPTLKFVTTTGRWEMLANEMDVNAGRFQDGMPMEELGRETFELTLEIASGKTSLGEQAGHSQVSIWRDWRQTDDSNLQAIQNASQPSGNPLPVHSVSGQPGGNSGGARVSAYPTGKGHTSDQVGLIVPTSLCSAQVARMIADKLNAEKTARDSVSRYVALVHTEGCGAAPGYSQQLFLRTLIGHLDHPMVKRGLLLEHGCEQTHNDAMRLYLEGEGLDTGRLGWASVQMDGGIDNVIALAENWFTTALESEPLPPAEEAGAGALRVGLTAIGNASEAGSRAMALLAAGVVEAGGLVVVPENATLLQSTAFTQTLLRVPEEAFPTLAYGQKASRNGFYIMEAPTRHAVETFTGLAATGVEVMLAHVNGGTLQSHPMAPLVQFSTHPEIVRRQAGNLDLEPGDEQLGAEVLASRLLERVCQVASRQYVPKLFGQGNTDFQLTRGLLGLTL